MLGFVSRWLEIQGDRGEVTGFGIQVDSATILHRQSIPLKKDLDRLI